MRMQCKFEGCLNDATQRGWCPKHYYRWLKNGDPSISQVPRYAQLRDAAWLRKQVLELRRSQIEIAEEVGCTLRTLTRALAKFNIQVLPKPAPLEPGQKFNRLTIVRRLPTSDARGRDLYECVCSCGNPEKLPVRRDGLESGHSKSCGCLRIESASTHGLYKHPSYGAWSSMVKRCRYQHEPYYGGRGIRMCEAWSSDFSAWLADVGEKPPETSFRRVDKDGHFSCGRCEECLCMDWSANARWYEGINRTGHNERRRARRVAAFVEHVDRETLYRMHGGCCGICKEFIDLNINPVFGRAAFHADHRIPLVRGGEHSYANMQPSHPRCNLHKHASL